MWDPGNMYFFLTVDDEAIRTDNADTWNSDGIVLYFYGDNSKNDELYGYGWNDTQM